MPCIIGSGGLFKKTGAGHSARSLSRVFPIANESFQNVKKGLNWSFVMFSILSNILSKGMDISECIHGTFFLYTQIKQRSFPDLVT